MHQRDVDAGGVQVGQHALESRKLLGRVGHFPLARAVGDREMREDALDDQAGQADQRRDESRGVAGEDAEAAHARVDLDVDARLPVQGEGGPREGLRHLQIEDRCGQIMAQGVARLPGRREAQDQDRGGDARLT